MGGSLIYTHCYNQPRTITSDGNSREELTLFESISIR